MREELVRHAEDFDDGDLSRLTVVLSFDKKDGHVGSIRYMPEYERTIPRQPRDG